MSDGALKITSHHGHSLIRKEAHSLRVLTLLTLWVKWSGTRTTYNPEERGGTEEGRREETGLALTNKLLDTDAVPARVTSYHGLVLKPCMYFTPLLVMSLHLHSIPT